MSKKQWIIQVADAIPKPWPPASQLTEVGVPLPVVAKYAMVRREMSPKGLKRKAWAARN